MTNKLLTPYEIMSACPDSHESTRTVKYKAGIIRPDSLRQPIQVKHYGAASLGHRHVMELVGVRYGKTWRNRAIANFTQKYLPVIQHPQAISAPGTSEHDGTPRCK